MSFISNAFAQGTTAGSAESSLMSFLPLILMFAVLYFIMIRPQMKRQKEHRNMLAAMAKGDEVVTNGGIVGKVTKVTDAYVGVEIARRHRNHGPEGIRHDDSSEGHDQVAVRPVSFASGAASPAVLRRPTAQPPAFIAGRTALHANFPVRPSP